MHTGFRHALTFALVVALLACGCAGGARAVFKPREGPRVRSIAWEGIEAASREELEAAIATSVENTESDDFSKHARAALGAATTKARTAWNELRERASKPDNTEALKQSMKDMGRGLSKGWGEVRKSLGNAYERLNASTRRTSEGAPARASNTGEGRSQ